MSPTAPTIAPGARASSLPSKAAAVRSYTHEDPGARETLRGGNADDVGCYDPSMVAMNISLAEDLAKRIEALATRVGKSVEDFIADAAKDQLEFTKSLIADVQVGLADADAGRMSSVDEVEARLKAKLFGVK